MRALVARSAPAVDTGTALAEAGADAERRRLELLEIARKARERKGNA